MARPGHIAYPSTASTTAAPGYGRGRAPARTTRLKPDKGGAVVWLVTALWILILFDVQWYIAAKGPRFVTRAPVLLFPALAFAMTFTVPAVKEWSRRWTWFVPLIAFTAVTAISVPFAPNPGRAFPGVQILMLYWTLIVATVAVTTSARRLEALFILFALQFTWWGLWGGTTGLVFWSPVLANYDAFGAYMVMGGGFCAFLVFALERGDRVWLRYLMIATVALCAVGMVASFARGAFLTAFMVALVVWLRSPKKGKTLLAGIICVVIVMAAAALLYGDEYWAEMSTIMEGAEEQTGEDRWAMWQAAWGVFLRHPVFGVGYENWGIFASEYYRPGELEGNYGMNPQWLWGRQAHNSYITILAENGAVGFGIFLWILWDFFKRNAYLRSKQAAEVWKSIGGRLQLRPMALGLEAAVVGWMGAAALYSMAGAHWFYTLICLNLTLHTVVSVAEQDALRQGLRFGPHPGKGVRRAPRMRPGVPRAGSGSFPAPRA